MRGAEGGDFGKEPITEPTPLTKPRRSDECTPSPSPPLPHPSSLTKLLGVVHERGDGRPDTGAEDALVHAVAI